jgi:spermidine/putrescine transport system substrate-binding protein
MIERMIKEDMLQPLDFSKLTNYDLVDEQYKGLFFDPEDRYSVPYSYGMTGLIYNTKMVEGEPDSWSIMWDPAYKDSILVFDNPRDAFGIAQFLLGIDVNSEDKADWDRAAEKLAEMKKIWQGKVMDEVVNKMEGGNAAIASYYAGDYMIMFENNPDLGFVYPKEGCNIFVDSACVTKNASNYDAAMMYINFLMEPEIALANAEYICYGCPITAVVENPEYSFYEDEILYPEPDDMPKVEYFHDIDPEIRSYYEKLWEKIIISD